ncbi:hypothetical protein AVEN_170225-1 [Araneus ventricosus]|uniref:Uncharacterized protein n=1 Tax=Araneus ventricosus TaxID=182803 RepID=A0A4Y2RFP2_ARAVE|nr:hypothetical protein AVEN_170225-1 [Araneus ventricosus]
MTMQGLTPQFRPELYWTLLARKLWTPYSPDLAPSDFHFFHHLKHHLDGNHYNDDEDVETAVTSWLLEQAASFYEEGIQNLVVRHGDMGRRSVLYHNRFCALEEFQWVEVPSLWYRVCGDQDTHIDVAATFAALPLEVPQGTKTSK